MIINPLVTEGGGTTYNSITETTTNTTISNSTIDLNGDVKVNGEPIVVPDMDNYFTKDESDARYELKPFDPATAATSPNFVYLTFNDGSEPRYDYYDSGSITNNAYSGNTNVESVYIGSGITRIGDKAFYRCTSLTSVTIGNSVTSIDVNAFYECTSLTSITIPNSVTSIGDFSFKNCTSLTEVTIGNSVTSIGRDGFRNCTSLTSITFPNSVTSIGDDAFASCVNLSNVVIPDSVTHISARAFRDCSNMSTFTIGRNVEFIGNNAIANNNGTMNIDSITSLAKVAPSTTFTQIKRNGTLYYPAGSDYSGWLSTDKGMLGYYGWTGVEIDVPPTLEERVEANENSIDTLDERVTALEEGGGGGIPQALHYESDEIEDGDITYREILDINKDESIHFHRSDDEADVHSTYINRDGMQYNDADDAEGTNMRATNVGNWGIDVAYDDAEMPATHIGYGSVEVTNSDAKMAMSTDEGFMGAFTTDDDGNPYRGVILQPDGTFNVFVDDAASDKSFTYLMNEDGVSINGIPQPIMQVLTKAEYEALETKEENVMYIVKG